MTGGVIKPHTMRGFDVPDASGATKARTVRDLVNEDAGAAEATLSSAR